MLVGALAEKLLGMEVTVIDNPGGDRRENLHNQKANLDSNLGRAVSADKTGLRATTADFNQDKESR